MLCDQEREDRLGMLESIVLPSYKYPDSHTHSYGKSPSQWHTFRNNFMIIHHTASAFAQQSGARIFSIRSSLVCRKLKSQDSLISCIS